MVDQQQAEWHELINSAFEDLIRRIESSRSGDDSLKNELQVLTDIATHLIRGERLDRAEQFILIQYRRPAA